jgi:preprotein translocase subunit SecF
VFQFLKNPQFDFMKYGRVMLSLSAVVVVVMVAVFAVHGLNLGIEFTGGTELQVKYGSTPDVAAIRSALDAAGLPAQVTTIGDAAENEIYIRMQTSVEGSSEDLTTRVTQTLRGNAVGPGVVDLNVADQAVLEGLLLNAPDLPATEAVDIARSISETRKSAAIFASIDDIAAIEGMTPAVLDYFEREAAIGPLAVRSQSYIYPAVGDELKAKTRLAIMLSLLMMMLYIWLRFQLRWGFAAVLALTHDTLITLGLFSIFGFEMSLPVVAAFLTLVGYSVNDTVVIFDRIRENLQNRSTSNLAATINLSINQTLSRTIITSGLTWVVVFGLFLYGGSALRAFAFVLSVGVIVGTYSSIYVASPVLVVWNDYLAARAKRIAGSTATAPAKKVRTS